MAKRKRAARKRTDVLMRRIDIDEFSARISAHPKVERGSEPEYEGWASLELRGRMDEPVRTLRDTEVVVYSTDVASIGSDPLPWVGTVDVVPPMLRPVVFLAQRDFDRLWVMALCGSLKHVHLVMTSPHYRTAYVVNFSFTTHPEE